MNNQQQSPTLMQYLALQIARESIGAEDTGHMPGDGYYWAHRYRTDLERILREFEEGRTGMKGSTSRGRTS